MEENLQVAIKHVKSEAADESSSALVLGSQDSPAPCGDTACRGGGAGDQTAEELQTVTKSTPVLLCECFGLLSFISLEISVTVWVQICGFIVN